MEERDCSHKLSLAYTCTHTHTHTRTCTHSQTMHNVSPEGLGVICGAVYLISMFLFIPIPFLPSLIPETETPFKHHEVCSHYHVHVF